MGIFSTIGFITLGCLLLPFTPLLIPVGVARFGGWLAENYGKDENA